MRGTNISPISEAIENWLKHNHLDEKLLHASIISNWEKMVGPVVNRHTKSLKIENKILRIVVDNAPLRNQLTFSKSQIIKMVNDEAGRQIVLDCFIL